MILMYHNVWPADSPNGQRFQSITILENEFERQIAWLRRFFDVVSLSEYLDRSRSQLRKKNCIAVTVDDGTETTFDIAVPIINKYKVPVTIFVTTCQLDAGPLIWGAYLNALCYENCYKSVEVAGEVLNLRSDSEKSESRRLLKEIATSSGDPKRYVDLLSAKYPIPEEIRKFYGGLTSQQFRDARDNPLVEIGGHSVNHYSLSTLNDESAKSEIAQCKDVLTKLTGREIEFFAYPSGDYDLRTIEYLKEFGFKAGFAVTSKRLGLQREYEIPRVGAYKTSRLMIKLLLYRLGLGYQEAAI